jgi:hypothetical protein
MRSLAQFAKAAGRGVAFESMDDATYAAYESDIARKPFQLQRLIIQRLQQFLGGLEEELPHFPSVLIGKLRHAVTSTF